jgi:aminoglycoside phosphotransferase (APT) family kinase protein
MQSHDDGWVRHFRATGYAGVEPLATGMEGAVYRLEDGLVAKVWRDKPPAELASLQRFYSDLSSVILPFATPQIFDIQDVAGTAVTLERELRGRPLQEYLSKEDHHVLDAAQACVSDVLAGLTSVHESQAALALPVLRESEPFRADATWSDALIGLLKRRVAVFGNQLRSALPDFDTTYECLIAAIAALNPTPNRAIHGDICGVNILVDEALVPSALLDWGFLSTAGDPAFDASIAAGIFNMYGPHAEVIEHQLLRFFEAELGYSINRLLIYRAAYAVATSNAYDVGGQDGHFAWCIRSLRRADIKEAIGIRSA